MFRIACTFDKGSGVDAMDPFGDIEMTDEHSTIVLRTTYLDSWFEALVRALDGIQIGAKLTVAIPEEPKPLHIDVGADGKITIQYENEMVCIQGKQAFEAALRQACESFLDRVSGLNEAARNPAITTIRQFYQTPA